MPNLGENVSLQHKKFDVKIPQLCLYPKEAANKMTQCSNTNVNVKVNSPCQKGNLMNLNRAKLISQLDHQSSISHTLVDV